MVDGERPKNLLELADDLGFAPQHLYSLVHSRDYLYVTASIPKRSGDGDRQIKIPTRELKGVQRAIYRKYLKPLPVSKSAYAFRSGVSVVDAADKVKGNVALLKIDIKDFFPSITERRVFGLFCSLGFEGNVSYILTRLTTHSGCLVQGAPTSPAISNLICWWMDGDLSKLSASWGLNYLRYSDDMLFWGPKHFSYKKLLGYCDKVIRDHGFRIKREKTKFYGLTQPRYVLGLSVHGGSVRLTRKARRDIRAAFFKASKNLRWAEENLSYLSGIAQWYKCVYGKTETYFEYDRIIYNVKKLRLHEPYQG